MVIQWETLNAHQTNHWMIKSAYANQCFTSMLLCSRVLIDFEIVVHIRKSSKMRYKSHFYWICETCKINEWLSSIHWDSFVLIQSTFHAFIVFVSSSKRCCVSILLLLLYFGTFPETWFWWYKASCVVLTGAFLLWSHRFDTFYDCAKKSNKVRIGIFRRQKNYTLFLLIISSGNEFYCKTENVQCERWNWKDTLTPSTFKRNMNSRVKYKLMELFKIWMVNGNECKSYGSQLFVCFRPWHEIHVTNIPWKSK